jgi:hypothetical protein
MHRKNVNVEVQCIAVLLTTNALSSAKCINCGPNTWAIQEKELLLDDELHK